MSGFDQSPLVGGPTASATAASGRSAMDMDTAAEGDWRAGREPGMALPKSADLMRIFTAPTGDLESHPVLRAGAALSAHHRAQWAAEDTCREHADDDRLVATAKRTIDALNARRVELVDQVDAWADGIRSVAEAALHTETLGQLIDRLAVAWVRCRNLTASAGNDLGRREDARRAMTQLAELCEAYDDLARDLLQGHRRLPKWRSLKRYGGAQ